MKNFILLFIGLIILSGCGDDSSGTTSNDSGENDLTFELLEPDWEYNLANANFVYSPTINNDTLYVTSYSDLFAINTDGTLKWRFESTPFNADVAVGDDNTIYLSQRDGSLTAINESGNAIWTYNTNSSYGQTPAIGCDGTIYFNTLYAIHALDKNGTLKWENGLDYTSYSSTIIDKECNIYTSTNKNIVAYDVNGSQKWSYAFSEYNIDAPKIIMDDNNVLYAKTYSTLISIDKNGTLLWSYDDVTGHGAIVSPVIDKDNTIYFSDAYGVIYALNNDGTLKWKYEDQLKGQYDIGGFMAIANDLLYINTYHQLYTLTFDGVLMKQDLHLADVRSTPILIDNKLYVGEGMYLKAYTIDNDGYQVGSPWPTGYHDNKHTGNKATTN